MAKKNKGGSKDIPWIAQIKCETCWRVFDKGDTCGCELGSRRWKPWNNRKPIKDKDY